MNLPETSDGSADRERRRMERLANSPGSFFVYRSRELTRAAPYFMDRLQEGTYSATRRQHFHTLCGASFAVLMSTFEVTWRTLFGLIVDTTSRYDRAVIALLRKNDNAELAESVLAHRGDSGAGTLVTSALGVWQQSALINGRYKAAFLAEPIASSDVQLLAEMWQVRHVIAHGSGVTTALDAYRLSGKIEASRALLIDGDYLSTAQQELERIVRMGTETVRRRMFLDFFSTPRSFGADGVEFAGLYMATRIFPDTVDFPSITATEFAVEQAIATTPSAVPASVTVASGAAAAAPSQTPQS